MSEWVCVRDRERERERECVCVCVWVWVSVLLYHYGTRLILIHISSRVILFRALQTWPRPAPMWTARTRTRLSRCTLALLLFVVVIISLYFTFSLFLCRPVVCPTFPHASACLSYNNMTPLISKKKVRVFPGGYSTVGNDGQLVLWPWESWRSPCICAFLCLVCALKNGLWWRVRQDGCVCARGAGVDDKRDLQSLLLPCV